MRGLAGTCACLFLSAGIALSGASPAAAGQEASETAIAVRKSVRSDPKVRSGTLPNGLRYFVQHAALPASGLSIRLGIEVGSVEERDNERGFAHFVEHLAFRQTRSAPADDITAQFARLGVAFGRDQNARTTEFETTYRLDFNRADSSGIDQGLRWLRDVADGLILSDGVVKSEHGVIIAEQVAGANEELRVNERIARFHGPDLRSVDRRPNGLKRSMDGIDSAALRAFYDRWYRPENAVLVIVGDRPAEELEKLARSNFASWQSKGPAPQRARLGRVNKSRGLEVMTLESPSFPRAISACRLQDPPSPADDELSHRAREIRRSIWQGILNNRFNRLTNEGNSDLLGAAIVDNSNDEYSATCVLTIPTSDDWQKALTATQLELLRFGKDGPTEQEFENQLDERRAFLRGAIFNEKARTAPAIAELLLDLGLKGRPIVSAAEAMHAYNVVVEELDQKGVVEAFRADWSGAGPLLSLVLPSKSDVADLRAAWERTAALQTLPAYADAAVVAWPYADFGKKGQVIAREVVERPGFTRVRFANGVILNFKHLANEPQSVDLRLQFGAGRKQLRDEDLPAATFGAGMLISGGLNRLPMSDIERHFRSVSWQFDFDVDNDHFEISHRSVSSNLSATLQIITAYLSDPGFRSDADGRIPAAIDMVYRQLATDPEMALSEAMSAAIDPEDPARLPAPEQLSRLRSGDFARVLKAPLTTEAIEVTIAGDVEEEAVVGLVGKTLGALPPRQHVDRRRADTRFMRVPDRAIPLIRATHQGPADQAAASLVWPLYVATPSRRREEYALQLVAAVFNEGLRQKVRSEMGKVYDPRVATEMPDHADQGLMMVKLASEPADIERLIAEARKLGARLAAGGITADELEAVRKPKLSAFAARRDKNSWWAAIMSGSARDPEQIDELVEYEGLMSSVTLDEVKAAAAKWLASDPIVGIALPKASPPSLAIRRGRSGESGQ